MATAEEIFKKKGTLVSATKSTTTSPKTAIDIFSNRGVKVEPEKTVGQKVL